MLIRSDVYLPLHTAIQNFNVKVAELNNLPFQMFHMELNGTDTLVKSYLRITLLNDTTKEVTVLTDKTLEDVENWLNQKQGDGLLELNRFAKGQLPPAHTESDSATQTAFLNALQDANFDTEHYGEVVVKTGEVDGKDVFTTYYFTLDIIHDYTAYELEFTCSNELTEQVEHNPYV